MKSTITAEQVHIVTSGSYSSYSIHCVFSTRNAADTYCGLHNNTRVYDQYRVEPYALDDPLLVQGIRAESIWFHVQLHPTQKPYVYPAYVEDDDDSMIEDREMAIEGRDKLSSDRAFDTVVLARDEDHAIKIASDRLAEHTAALEGVS